MSWFRRFGGRCPRCQDGALFKGFLALDERCESCGLNYDFADAGDGPAVFVILLAGAVAVGLTMWVEFTYRPAIWVHLAIMIPTVLIACLVFLRPMKAWLVRAQYRNQAREGRVRR